MSATFFQLKSFFNYWLDAVNEHSLHSPFLFNFYNNVLKNEPRQPEVEALAAVKKKLRHDHRTIHVTDLGAGSLKLKTNERKISDIANISTTPEKYSALYARIISYFQCKHILELGTSLGVNTLYLSKANPEGSIVTFEGCPEISKVARQIFEENAVKNVRLIEGDISETLPAYLSKSIDLDFALIDANHRFAPTMQYVEWLMQKVHAQTVLAVDDIHYSADMERAWEAIQQHPSVHTTIDLYRCGLVFFDPSLTKQNVVLHF